MRAPVGGDWQRSWAQRRHQKRYTARRKALQERYYAYIPKEPEPFIFT